jgi:hypothetical protein
LLITVSGAPNEYIIKYIGAAGEGENVDKNQDGGA